MIAYRDAFLSKIHTSNLVAFEIEIGCMLYVYPQGVRGLCMNGSYWVRSGLFSLLLGAENQRMALIDYVGKEQDRCKTGTLLFSVANEADGNKELYPEHCVIQLVFNKGWLAKQIEINLLPRDSLLFRLLRRENHFLLVPQMLTFIPDIRQLLLLLEQRGALSTKFFIRVSFYKLLSDMLKLIVQAYKHEAPLITPALLAMNRSLKGATRLLDKSIQQKFPGISELAYHCHMSASSFLKKFTAVYGMTPFVYFRNKQMQHAQELLKKGVSVKKIAYLMGYKDPANFTRAFKSLFGVSPKHYQQQNTAIGHVISCK